MRVHAPVEIRHVFHSYFRIIGRSKSCRKNKISTFSVREIQNAMLSVELNQQIDAPIDEVWSTIADPLRRGDFTGHEITLAEQSGTAPIGPNFRWREQGALLGRRYQCECRMFGWEPIDWLCFGSRFLFQISYKLVPTDEGTRLIFGCEFPLVEGIPRSAFTNLWTRSLRSLKQIVESDACLIHA